jgi:hypothetical protein
MFSEDSWEAMIVRIALRFNKTRDEVLDMSIEDIGWHYAAVELENEQMKKG